jgi:hypothetical protein
MWCILLPDSVHGMVILTCAQIVILQTLHMNERFEHRQNRKAKDNAPSKKREPGDAARSEFAGYTWNGIKLYILKIQLQRTKFQISIAIQWVSATWNIGKQGFAILVHVWRLKQETRNVTIYPARSIIADGCLRDVLFTFIGFQNNQLNPSCITKFITI